MNREPFPDLDAESQIELTALKRALRMADGFALYVARTNTAVLRQQIIADLRASLPRPLIELTLSLDEPPYEQMARVAEGAPADAVLSVERLDVLAPSDDPDWLLKELNWRRAAYRRLARPLLLWVPEYLLRLLMQHAPDFYDWHSGFYEFATPESARVETTQQVYAIGGAEQADLTREQKRERMATLRGLLDEYVGEEPEIRQARADLLGKLGILHDSLGEVARAIEFYQQALDIAREIGDRRGEGNHLGNLGLAYSALGEMARAIEYYQQALDIAREIGDRRGEGNGLGNLGLAYSALGEVARAIEYYQRALEIAREIGDRRGEGNRLGNLGLACSDLGEVARAIEFYQQALGIAREIGDRRNEGAVLGNVGIAYSDLGEVGRAIEFYQQALDIAREIGDRRGEGNRLGNLGTAYSDLGEVAQALEYYQQALDIAREIGDQRVEALTSWNLGLLYEDSEPARAVELMQVLVDYERDIGHPDAESHATRVEEIRARL